MAQLLTTLVTTNGLLAVLLLMIAESCGLSIPSEVVVPVAAAFAAGGHLNLAAVILLGATGNLLGSLIAYSLAACFGQRVLLGPGRWIGISRSHLDLVEGWFERYGLAAIFFTRMLPVVRSYISFPAGLARVNPVRFSALTFAGALPWCGALGAAGYVLGLNYRRVAGPIEMAAIGFGLMCVLAVLAWFIRGRRLSAAAE